MQKIVNLVSWAGGTFSYSPGEVIEVDELTAEARIEAGLAAPVEAEPEQLELAAGGKRRR